MLLKFNCGTADRGYPRTRESRAAALYAYRSSCQTIGTAWRKGISWTKDRRSPGSSQQQYPCQCQRHGRWQRKTLSSQRHRRGLYGHQNDGQDTLDPTITPRESGLVLPPDEIRQLLAEKGIVGMGGATFPTHVKYAPQSSGRIIDTVILNGIECEPFITADYRILIEHADEVIRGLKYFLKASLANKGIIAIEDNKPRAIELFNQLTADDPNISVVVCPENILRVANAI